LGDWLDLDRDLPTTADDVVALRRFRTGPRLSFDQYLEALAVLEPSAALRARRGPCGEPFDLLGRRQGDRP
jgi:hypothetical protein